jgi:hypothetical protein
MTTPVTVASLADALFKACKLKRPDLTNPKDNDLRDFKKRIFERHRRRRRRYATPTPMAIAEPCCD